MMVHFFIMFASILLLCKIQTVKCDDQLVVPMTLVQNASAIGAYCLDGSPPAYHIHKGSGEGANNWILQFEGGGWCNSMRSCRERAPTRRGSTRYMVKYLTFNGILSNKASLNPDFYNWNRVKIRYCDGGSFAGDTQMKDGTSLLHLRGQRIWQAIIQDLLPKGLGQAKMALLGGCSAGGLATFLHCDNFTSYLPKTASVKCLSDAGFFMNVNDVSLKPTARDYFSRIVSFHGAEQNLNKNCTSLHKSPQECIFPQYSLQYIKTPFFVLNTAYDVFQFNHILVPPSSDPSGNWKKCKANPTSCNPDQLAKLQGFRNDMLSALRSFSQSSQSGGLFINSCFAHCQSESVDTWSGVDSPRINNKTIAKAVGDWYFNMEISKLEDCPYPCDTTCHNQIGAGSIYKCPRNGETLL